MRRYVVPALLVGLSLLQAITASEPLRLGTFDVDATPPVGSPLAYDPTKGVDTPLSCRGIVLAGAGKPIVLCLVDWIGISNGGQTEFREGLAKAAGTDARRVAVHTVHQHDAPRCDFSAEALLAQQGLSGVGFDVDHARDVIRRAAAAVKAALDEAEPVTHVGLGIGIVEKVASNRRILGPDGKVKHTRWTACKDPKIRAFPVGTIDPELKLICFFNSEEPLASLTYYATHPQSYYRTGLANPDFPGLARNARQQETGVLHVHFTGAAGNIGAGKWNDGSKENRQVLADRVAAGMKRAWDSMKKSPVSAEDVAWSVEPVLLPPSEHMDEDALVKTVENPDADPMKRWYAAKNLVWLRRCRAGEPIDLSCLAVGNARVLHMPGELLVEYQLGAQKLREDLFVAMAAYGEYAPGYIAPKVAYSQGGYEASPGASKVAPEVEGVLMEAVGKLLGAGPKPGAPRPNIVLITADNLGYHDTGCYGNNRVITPNIDRLAAEGVRCTNFHSASPTCTVSRAAYLTGRYPQRNGLTHQLRTNLDKGIDENMSVGLRYSERLLPEYLKPLGYPTACFGKWNIGFAPGSRPTERGFDEYLGNASGNCDYYTHVYAGRNDFFRGTEPVPDMKGYSTFLLADAACDFVRRNAKRPFFLYVPFNAVHYPGARNKAPGVECIWQAPDEAFEQYGWSPDTRDVDKRYYATVTALDMGIGRVLDQLDRLSLAGNTLVIFFSDNGAFKAQMGYASNHPFRTESRMIYEGSIRVACAVRWPGRIGPGTICDEMLVSMDFVPMVLKAAGAPLPEDRVIDGRDPTATLAGTAPSPHEILFWQYAGCEAAREGKWKIVRTSYKKPFEFYDLEADPGETNDLAADKPEVVEGLQRKFEAWAAAVQQDSKSE